MKKRLFQWRLRKKMTPFLLILPAIALFCVFSFYPIVYAGWISLHKWQVLGGHNFVSFSNYIKLLGDHTFHYAVKITFLYIAGVLPLVIGLSLAFALLLTTSRRIYGRGFFKTSIFIPSITPLLAMGLLWRFIYSYEYGIFNYYLIQLGFEKMPWLNSFTWALPTVIITAAWHAIGWNMIIFIAGIQAIPEQLYEAARIDGADKRTILRYITLPLLKPTLLFVGIMASIGAFKAFGLIWGLTRGGPGTATTTLMVAVYTKSFVEYRMGMGAALTFFLLVIIIIITILQLRVFRSESVY